MEFKIIKVALSQIITIGYESKWKNSIVCVCVSLLQDYTIYYVYMCMMVGYDKIELGKITKKDILSQFASGISIKKAVSIRSAD